MLDVYRIERQYTSYRFYLFLLAATLIGSSLSLLFFRIVGIARVDHLGFLVSDLTVAVSPPPAAPSPQPPTTPVSSFRPTPARAA